MRIEDVFARIEAENPGILDYDHQVDPPVIVALNVVRARARLGMTQAQLAEAVGVAQPRIAELERGDANPRLATLAKIAQALGVTLSELLADDRAGGEPVSASADPVPVLPAVRNRRAG